MDLTKNGIDILISLLLVLSIATKNKSMTISLATLLLVKYTFGESLLNKFSQYGLTVGVIILTIGLLSPLALGKYDFNQIKEVVLSRDGIIGLLAGVTVAILGSKGVAVSEINVQLLLGVIFGTIIGVAFFKGNPVGPIIGSGFAYVVIVCIEKIQGIFT